jgi:hypothetical protein
MLAGIAWLLAIVAGSVVAYFLFRRAHPHPAQPTSLVARPPTYHCVEIQGDDPSCASARQLAGRRFLSDEAPALPVPGCDQPHCRCRYVHHEDRRQHDRRNPYGQWALPPSLAGERRARADRRRADGSGFRPSISIG